jgi:hypothetical protein
MSQNPNQKSKILFFSVIFIIFLSSCYTKNQAVKKFCKQDTIEFTTTIHDTIIIDSVQVDTIFNDRVDSVYINNDRIEIQYVKKYGKIYLQGKCKGDTIYHEKILTIKVPSTCEKLSRLDQFVIDYKWHFLLVIGFLLVIIYMFCRKK